MLNTSVLRTVTLVLLLIACVAAATAPWVQTNGPYGGAVSHLYSDQGRLLASCSGKLFLYSCEEKQWSSVSGNFPAGVIIRAVMISRDTLFAGTQSGIFVSVNNGLEWKKIDSVVHSAYINAMTVHGDTILAGGASLFISTDNGASWSATGKTLNDKNINVLFINKSRFYAGTWKGIAISADGGTTWTDANTGITTPYILDIAAIGDTLFTATSGGIYYSVNDGLAWTKANSGLADTVTVSLVQNSAGIFAGTRTGVYLSTDRGANWKPVTTGLTNKYVMTLAVSGESVFAGTSAGVFTTTDGSSWSEADAGMLATEIVSLVVKKDKILAGTPGGVFLTTDNGDTWTAANAEPFSGCNLSCLEPGVADSVWAGTDNGGAFVSADFGKSWADFSAGLPEGVPIGCITVKNNYIFAGTAGRGVYLTTTHAPNWGESNVNIAKNAYVSSLYATNTWVYCATDGGFFMMNISYQKWNSIRTGGNSVSCIVKNNNGTVFCGSGSHGLLIFEDTLDRENTGIPQNSAVTSFAVINNTMLAGTQRGVYYSPDNGAGWTAFDSGFADADVKSLAINGEFTAFAGMDAGGVWRRALPKEIVPVTEHETMPTSGRRCRIVTNGADNSRVTVELYLANPGKCRVEVYALSGRSVVSIDMKTVAPGLRRVTWPKRNGNAGCYVVRVTNGTDCWTKNVAVLASS